MQWIVPYSESFTETSLRPAQRLNVRLHGEAQYVAALA